MDIKKKAEQKNKSPIAKNSKPAKLRQELLDEITEYTRDLQNSSIAIKILNEF